MKIREAFYLVVLIGTLTVLSSCANSYSALGSSENQEIDVDNSVLSLGDYLRRVPQLYVRGTGDNLEVQLRENSSQAGSPSPLYVVDGQKMGRDYSRVSRTIDSNDIESVRALTNASDTAIYGLDGSSGVILIKTKSR